MIRDDQLDAALQSYHRDPATHRDPEAVVERVVATPIEEMPHRRGLLPRLPARWAQSSLGAVGFVAAGAVVALLGGLLLAGILTHPSEETLPPVGASPSAEVEATTTPPPTPELRSLEPLLDSIPGLQTQQVGAGIVRVVGDGTGRSLDDLRMLHIAHDGSVWAGRDRRVFRLGEPGWSPPLSRTFNRYDFLVSDEGNLRARDRQDGLQELRGGRWVQVDPGADQPQPAHPDANEAVRLRASDGSWWFGSDDVGRAEVLHHTADDGWEVLPLDDAQTTAAQLLETPDGTLWAVDYGGPGGAHSALFRFVDGRWRHVSIPGDGSTFWPESMRLDERRALVVRGIRFDGDEPVPVNVLLDGGDWVVAPYRNLEVASFGDLGTEFPMLYKANLLPLGSDGIGWAIQEDGRFAIYFDGERTTRVDIPFRRGAITPAIDRWSVAPDGSLWVTVLSDHPSGNSLVGEGLYVISPEAVSATDQ